MLKQASVFSNPRTIIHQTWTISKQYRQKNHENSDHFFQTQTSETGLIMSVYSVWMDVSKLGHLLVVYLQF